MQIYFDYDDPRLVDENKRALVFSNPQNTSDGAFIFHTNNAGADVDALVIDRNGTAEFAGNVVAANSKFTVTPNAVRIGDNTGSASQNSASVINKATGTVSIFHENGSSALFLQCLKNGVPSRAQIATDGSAQFAGDITANNVKFNLEPDNAANYTTTTDAEGNETQVYNGPTLDVKERLEKAQETFEELQVAVANATDFNALKAAMLTALQDYS